MKVKRIIPFILAVIIFIVSNFIQMNLGKKKKNIEGRISTIEKDLTAYLQYAFITTIDFNFAQSHLSGVMENTQSNNAFMKANYMSLCFSQMVRGLSSLTEAAKSISISQPANSEIVLSNLKKFKPEDGFDSFTKTYFEAIEVTKKLQDDLKKKVQDMGEEKISLKNESSEISIKESRLLSFIIAINFLILLFTYIEKNQPRQAT